MLVVALVIITSHAMRRSRAGQHTSIRLQDGRECVFDLASLNVHQAAKDTHGRESVYCPTQPDLALRKVLRFDALPRWEDLRLVAVVQ